MSTAALVLLGLGGWIGWTMMQRSRAPGAVPPVQPAPPSGGIVRAPGGGKGEPVGAPSSVDCPWPYRAQGELCCTDAYPGDCLTVGTAWGNYPDMGLEIVPSAFMPGQLIVGRRGDLRGGQDESLLAGLGFPILQELAGLNAMLIAVPVGTEQTAMQTLLASGLFRYVEPNYLMQAFGGETWERFRPPETGVP